MHMIRLGAIVVGNCRCNKSQFQQRRFRRNGRADEAAKAPAVRFTDPLLFYSFSSLTVYAFLAVTRGTIGTKIGLPLVEIERDRPTASRAYEI